MKVNLLCLVGAALGAVCILLPWAVVSERLVGEGDEYQDYLREAGASPLRLLTDDPADGLFYLVVASVLFVVGTLVAFLTPIGGLGQLGGIVFFTMNLKDSLPHILPILTIRPPPGYSLLRTYSYSIWYFLAVLATFLTLASALVLVRMDLSGGIRIKMVVKAAIRERLHTFRRS